MEHGVYICTWNRSSEGFTLWVKSRPHLRAWGRTFDEAETRLIRVIQESGGAIQAVFEIDPPPPKSALDEKYSQPAIYLISGDDRFEADGPKRLFCESTQETDERLRWLDSFYEAAICRKCKHTVGRRNEKPVLLTRALKYDGAFGSIGPDGGPSHQVFSEDFLKLLTPEEVRYLKFQPTARRRGRKFFELIAPEGIPFVAVAGFKISGWRCAMCDHHEWGYWVNGMSIRSFIARSDVPASPRGIFTVGRFPEIELAVTASRWQELMGKKGARGFVSRLLGIAPATEVVRRPELPTVEERLREGR